IRAVVANGSSGKVEIYNQAATAISAQNFNFTGPEITSFTPATGSTGDTIIIDGSKFININAVRFGGTASPYFNAISPSQIKAVVGDGSSGNVEVISGSDTARKYGFFMRPHILSFYPTGTGKDSVVTIKGKFFTGVYYVTFGGVSASFTFISDSIIKAVVPANGYGSVNVYASGGIASSPGFILIKPPELSGYSPYVGGINTEVAIFGYYLDSVKEVKFGGVDAASFNIVSSTQLTARVGAGATGSVTVKSVGGEATFFGFNYYKKPVITSFSPAKAGPMDIITIRGSNLNGIRVRGDSYVGFLSVKFDSVEQVRLHDYNDTIIKVSPGAGATGKIYVQTPGGQDSISGFVYLAVPVISSIEPIAAPVASAVIITGNNFSNAPDSNFVYFGNARAAVTSSTNTSLTVIVPPGATFEPLSVTVNTKTAYSQRPFIVTYPQDSALFQKAYSTRIDLPLGYKPLAKLADVDGDGKSDLVIADKENNKISVYKNNSTPGLLVFEPKLDFYTGSNPVIQEIKDLDGDGKLDILLVRDSLYDGNARLSVLKNTGNNSGINFLYSNNIGYSYGLTSGTLSDLNSDGKPDLVLRPPAYTNIGSEYIDGLQNYNTDTSMNFSLERSINVSNGITISGEIATASKIIPADFNNDGRNDLLIGLFRILPNGYYFPPYITLLKNDLWSPYNTNFSKAFLNVPDVTNPRVGDLNFDNLPDIISDTVSLINTGNFTFTPQTNTCIECDFIGDMDGDGKPDLGKLKGDTFEIVRNKTTVNGEVTLTSKISFFTGTNASYYTIGDIDGDGKPDIIVSRFADSIISILKNKVAETIVVCPGDSLTLTSSLSGNSYQWQLNSGNGFGNISDNVIYSGTNTAELQLKPVSDSSYGYIYRCLVAGKTSYPYTIKFENNWNGNVSQAWENAANWSCITVPGATSDVTINSGNVIISSNAIVKSLTVKPGAKVTVAKGYSLTVLK
ncbi:MAG: IPT/TIG domain-containing protein, partial [Ferruginibacter sp.]